MPGGCFLSRGGMFFLAGVVAGRTTAPMCDCIARPIFGFLPLGATFGACLLLRSLVGRLEASGMCSLDQHEEGGFSDVRFEPLNRNKKVLNILNAENHLKNMPNIFKTP